MQKAKSTEQHYRVICLNLAGSSNRIIYNGEIVKAQAFPTGHAEELVKTKGLEEYNGPLTQVDIDKNPWLTEQGYAEGDELAEVEMPVRLVTQQDLDAHPELSEAGVIVGDGAEEVEKKGLAWQAAKAKEQEAAAEAQRVAEEKERLQAEAKAAEEQRMADAQQKIKEQEAADLKAKQEAEAKEKESKKATKK